MATASSLLGKNQHPESVTEQLLEMLLPLPLSPWVSLGWGAHPTGPGLENPTCPL